MFKLLTKVVLLSVQVQANQRASLPDSTGDQPQITAQDEVLTQSTDDKLHGPSRPPSSPQDQSSANHVRSLEEQQHQALLEDSNEALCAVCQTGGELLCCDKCLKVFHLSCHVPSLLKSPRQGEIYILLLSDGNVMTRVFYFSYIYQN